MAYTSVIELFEGVELDLNSENTFCWNSLQEQSAYFSDSNYVTRRFDAGNFKFIREDGYIKVNASHNFLENVNYMRFNNIDETTQHSKWYYAFITKVEYINDTTTGIYFVIDVLQTWLPTEEVGVGRAGDYSLSDCFIERQHSETDNIGDNVVTENVLPYKFKSYETQTHNLYTAGFYVVILAKWAKGLIQDGLRVTGKTVDGHFYNNYSLSNYKIEGTICGCFAFIFDDMGELDKALTSNILDIAPPYTYLPYESIATVYLLPKVIVNEELLLRVDVAPTGQGEEGLWHCKTFPTTRDGQPFEYRPKVDDSFNVHFSLSTIGTTIVPKNKKIFTSQYNKYRLINTRGSEISYEPEGFTDGNGNVISPAFEIIGTSIAPVKLCVKPYKNLYQYYYGSGYSVEQLFDIGDMPHISLNVDTFKEWLTHTSLQILSTLVPATVGAMAAPEITAGLMAERGAMHATMYQNQNPSSRLLFENLMKETQARRVGESSGRQIGALVGSQTLTQGVIKTASDAVSVPRYTPKAIGTADNIGNVLASNDTFYLVADRLAPTEDEITRIDNFFTAYGYAQNKIATPKIKTRNRFTYVKTRGASFLNHKVPSEYMRQINEKFDAGVRFWRYDEVENDFLNYGNLTAENAIPTP